jgi:hypothetical protein
MSVARGEQPRVDAEGRRTIDGALRWLASKQAADGHWGDRQHKAAFTAYAVMAFLAGGQLPDEGPQGAAVSRGVRYLLDCVRADGYVVTATGSPPSPWPRCAGKRDRATCGRS